MRSRRPLDTPSLPTVKKQVNERLAKALRDNLHRRKAQARARKTAPATEAVIEISPDEKSRVK